MPGSGSSAQIIRINAVKSPEISWRKNSKGFTIGIIYPDEICEENFKFINLLF